MKRINRAWNNLFEKTNRTDKFRAWKGGRKRGQERE